MAFDMVYKCKNGDILRVAVAGVSTKKQGFHEPKSLYVHTSGLLIPKWPEHNHSATFVRLLIPVHANGYRPHNLIFSYIHPKGNTIFYLPTTIFITPDFSPQKAVQKNSTACCLSGAFSVIIWVWRGYQELRWLLKVRPAMAESWFVGLWDIHGCTGRGFFHGYFIMTTFAT